MARQGRFAGLAVDAHVEPALDPGAEAVVELVEAPDADLGGLEQEALPDDPVQALLLAPPLGGIGPTVDQADAQDGAAPGELGATV